MLSAVNCSKDDATNLEPDQITSVNTIAPESAAKGNEVTITGTNFGTDVNMVSVQVADKEAIVTSVTDTQIKFVVPTKAFNGGVTLTINGESFTFSEFTYLLSNVQVSTLGGAPLAAAGKMQSVVQDANGDFYVSNLNSHKILKITTDGQVSVFAGSTVGYTDGNGEEAQFYSPKGLAIDSQGNIYVADSGNYVIRKISTDGEVSTVAGQGQGDVDGTLEEARFTSLTSIAVDNNDNLYVTDTDVHKIKMISVANDEVSTFVGSTQGYNDGNGSFAKFSYPNQIHFGNDNALYIAEGGYNSGVSGVRKVTLQRAVSTVSGEIETGYQDGSVNTALFNNPNGIAMDALGHIYIADSGNYKIRKISPNGDVITLAGSSFGFADGEAGQAKFSTSLEQIWVDENFDVYVADLSRIRKITQE